MPSETTRVCGGQGLSKSILLDVKMYLAILKDQDGPDEELRASWEVFFFHCDQLIRRYASLYVHSHWDLDDCVQEVWAKLVLRLTKSDYDPARGTFSTWLYRVVHDTTISYFRHEARHAYNAHGDAAYRARATMDTDPTLHMQYEDALTEAQHLLMRIRNILSEQNFHLVQLRWLYGLSVEEVAQRMHLTHQQVWYREHRAKKKLRAALAEHAHATA